MKKLLFAATMVAVLGIAPAALAQGQPQTTICHPVAAPNGGNTGAGYSIITTANPSVHIDEVTGAPKHNFDGRVDFVVTAETPCPPADSTPTPTPTQTPDPDPTDTPTPDPTDTPTPTDQPPTDEPPPPGDDAAGPPTSSVPPNLPFNLANTGFDATSAGVIAGALTTLGFGAMVLARKRWK